MRIKVKIHGHQHYHEIIGEVLYWCTGVEHYSRPGNMQVPAVLLNTGDKVELVTLQRDLYWTEIENLPETVSPESPSG